MIIYEDEELIIPAGLAHSLTEGDIVNNDTIAVTITENGTRVLTPDASHTGFSRVTIDTSVNLTTQDKSIDSSTEIQTISADSEYDALGEVTILPYVLDGPKTVDSSTNPQVLLPANDGLSKVVINPYTLSPLELDSSTVAQIRTGQFSNVTVNPYTVENKNVEITENGTISIEPTSTNALSKVRITTNITYSTQDKTVDSSTEAQTISPDEGYDGLGEVTVHPYVLDNEKIVDSSTNPQVIIPVNDGLSKVIINPYTLSPLEFDSSTVAQTRNGQFSTVTVNPYTTAEKTVDINENGALHVLPTDSSTLSAVHLNINVQPNLQSKSVDSSTARQIVTPSENYDGLSSVEVLPYELDTKTVDSSTVAQVVESDVDGLKEVHINPFILNNLIVDSSTVMQQFDPSSGFGRVKVNPYTLQEKSLTITQRGEYTITPDSNYNGLSSVILTAATDPVLQSKRVDSSTATQTVVPDASYDGLANVVVNAYTTEIRSVKSTEETQVITPNTADAISKVTVNPIALENKIANISNNGQEVVSIGEGYDGIRQITINTNVSPNLQTKTVDSSTVRQDVVFDSSNYQGLSRVIVNPYALEEKTVILSENGTTNYYPTLNGFKKFTIVNNTNPVNNEDKELTITMNNSTTTIVPATGYTGLGTVVINTQIPSDIHNQKKTVRMNTNGTVTVTADEDYTGLSQVTIVTDVVPNIQTKVVNSSTNGQVVTADYPYEYLSAVTVNPYTLDNIVVDASVNSQVFYPTHDGFASFTVNPVLNVVPGNIRSGVTILGITGTFQGGDLQERTLNSSTNEQIITPTSGYYGISKVTVAPYLLQSKTANSSTNTQTITFDSSVNGLSSVTINPYVLDSKTVYPSTSQQVITSAADGLSSVTIKPVTSNIDPNIQPNNIKQGVTILGVQGNVVPLVAQSKTDNITIDSSTHTIVPDEDYNALSEVHFNALVLNDQRTEIYNRLYNL